MNQNMTEKRRMLMDINVLDFTTTELREYLDTHPFDTDAIAYLNRYNGMLHQITKEYTAKFGPIRQDMHGNCMDEWKWATSPMPWEGGAC